MLTLAFGTGSLAVNVLDLEAERMRIHNKRSGLSPVEQALFLDLHKNNARDREKDKIAWDKRLGRYKELLDQ